jgi:hypothetical protein
MEVNNVTPIEMLTFTAAIVSPIRFALGFHGNKKMS